LVEWSKLKTYEEDQPHSFEELCYQIAKGLYEDEGKFTRVDDSGGGDGVEFYLTLPNGDEWGWQAKFFLKPTGRLNVSNRKTQIKKSLKRACEKHPNLKKWILCTPSNFTPNENTWFEETLVQLVSESQGIELEHWGNSDFNNWLSEPRFNGKRLFFFGELELNMNWFCTQYEKQNSLIKTKFNHILHSETNIDPHIKSILGDEELIEEIKYLIGAIKEDEFADYLRYKEQCFSIFRSHIENSNISELYDCLEFLEESLHHAFFKSEDIYYFLNEKMFFESCKKFKDYFWESLEPMFNKCSNLEDLIISEFSYETRIDDDEINRILGATGRLVDLLLSIQQDINSILEIFHSINQSELHIVGEPGIGKTHVSSNICYENLESNLPAIFVLGRHFTNGPLGEQLLKILDIPRTYSLTNFLEALETAAESYQVKIPLIIDGLNESLYNGEFSDVWELGLPSLIQEIKEYKNLVLITTCRPTYIDDIWINKPNNLQNLHGFGFNNIKDAINKYFDYYKIKADLNESSISQFEHPIYLKIFCETKNPERKEEKNIYIGDYTLFEIFEEYLSNINTVLCKRIGLHQSASFLVPRLKKIAEYLWNEDKSALPLDEMVKLIDGQSLDELENWPTSKSKYILDEGLLINRDRSRGNDIVFFTYDLLGGYLIAKYLIEQSEDIEETIKSEKIINLFSEDGRLHPLYEDIRRCLAALIPVKTDKYLHQLLDNPIALNSSIEALFEIPNEYVNEYGNNIINELFEIPQNREALLNLAVPVLGHVNHHFNIIFWNELLKELPLADRDISWTEYLRENVSDLEKKLIYFEGICKSDEIFSDFKKKHFDLIAINAMWFLTSTVKKFRDNATRALYWYGRKFPEKLLDLTIYSFKINDPYISERMLAAIYGVSMAKQYDFGNFTFTKNILLNYGRKLYDLMFKENAPFSTTHILARDYAVRTIQIALIHHPEILAVEEIERIQPPFNDGGIREWGESKDKDDGKYREGNYPLDGIVHDDLVSFLGLGMDRYQRPPEYKKAEANLWWRMYDLGYSLDIFGEIDKEIASWSSRGLNKLTDMYGRKYAKIATFELAGYRDDLGLLKDEWDNYQRMSFADIDPSFPEEIEQHNLVKEDFLEDYTIPVNEWILKEDIPDLKNYLILDEIKGEKGPWVLLDGFIDREDSDFNRNTYIFPRGILVRSEDEFNLIEKLENQNLFEKWLPEVPEDYYVYFGEIPWCDTFHENDLEELFFEINKNIVISVEEHYKLERNGELLSKDEENKIWENLPNVKVLFMGSKMITIPLNGDDPEKTIKSELKKQNLELKVKKVEIEKEVPEYEIIEILIPVRENNWENERSPLVPSRNVATPNKQIIEFFNLCNQPQTFNFYEKNGKIASMVFSSGKSWHSEEKLIYLRQDLLELFLLKNNYKLIWAIWGAKEFCSEDTDELFKFRKENQDQNPFQEIVAYESLKNQNEILTKKLNSKLIKE